jgi:basic membrane protein A
MTQPKTLTAGLLGAGLAILLSGCSLFSSQATPPPAPSPTVRSTAGTSISFATATPTAIPHLVRSITLVALIGEPKDWTPAGLTWKGVQTEAARIGATASLEEPDSATALAADLESAAKTDGAVVVTVGPAADPAVQVAATAHPATQFLEMDVVAPDSSPANVHGLAFDEAEAGYLGGYVAAAFASSGSGSASIGMVGDTKTDARSANYEAGFRSGAAEESPDATVAVAYATNPDSPDKGRTAAAGLIQDGSTVIMAMPSLSGIGALREACAGKTRVVAVDTDAWQTVPDIRTCLIVSVMKRYDAAVAAAIETTNSAGSIPRVVVNDVANGGISFSEFHATVPAGFLARLAAVVATLKAGPPRPTSAPPTATPSGCACGTPSPSGT